MKQETCDKAPKGWKCTREKDHEGPCAAEKVSWWKGALNSLGNALGEAFMNR